MDGNIVKTRAKVRFELPRSRPMLTVQRSYRVGYWISDKKAKRLNWAAFQEYARARNVELVKLDLDVALCDQGQFDCIVHKLTDIWSKSEAGDHGSALRWTNFQKVVLQEYVDSHPLVPVLDPLPSMRVLCDRSVQYAFLHTVCNTKDMRSPAYMSLTTDWHENAAKMRMFRLTYPIVCKPVQAHGQSDAHTMCLVLNEASLRRLSQRGAMVAQSFVPHNAVLYKVFVLGHRVFVENRPSLRNFEHDMQTAGDTATEPIWFDSHDISKQDSCCELTQETSQMDSCSECLLRADSECVQYLVNGIRACAGLNLFGVDLVVDRRDKRTCYAIDLNMFPGYDGVPNLQEHLLSLVTSTIQNQHLPPSPSVVASPATLTPKYSNPWLSLPLTNQRRTSSGIPLPATLGPNTLSEHNEPPKRCISNLIDYMKTSELTDDSAPTSPTPDTDSVHVVKAVNKCVSAVRAHGPVDSGLGTSESETSDNNLRHVQLLQRHGPGRKSASDLEHAKKEPDVAHHTHPRTNLHEKRLPLFPDWARIKQFYGIPKPPPSMRISSKTNENVNLEKSVGEGKESVAGQTEVGNASQEVAVESSNSETKDRANTLP